MSTIPRHINVAGGQGGHEFPTFPSSTFPLHSVSFQCYISSIKTHDVGGEMAFPPQNTRHVAIKPCTAHSGLPFAQVHIRKTRWRTRVHPQRCCAGSRSKAKVVCLRVCAVLTPRGPANPPRIEKTHTLLWRETLANRCFFVGKCQNDNQSHKCWRQRPLGKHWSVNDVMYGGIKQANGR